MGAHNDRVATKVVGREIRFARYQLTVTDGPDATRSINGGEDEVSIGTAEGNTLVLTDPTVSRHHVAITPTPRGHLVRDLGSTNGTSINGVLVERGYVGQSSLIAIGDTRLRFTVSGDDERAKLSADQRWGNALGASAAMRRLFEMLPRIAKSDATVLLEGETGTGKSLIASAIHDESPRAKGPFIVVDCGAIPPSLIESELFGHEKGSFTGATTMRIGAFEAAHGGTLFLDEIGELPLDMQPKLLRALEERVVKRIGRNESIALDIRLIAATNRDLRSEVNQGRFRADLYYRLNSMRVRIAPLRERREDIPLLVAHYYDEMGAGEPPADVLVELARHDWPGNVRELRAAVERAVLLGDPGLLPASTSSSSAATDRTESFRAAKERATAQWEREYLRGLIAQHEGNISRAARAVRMDRNHLRELLVKHGIRAEGVDG